MIYSIKSGRVFQQGAQFKSFWKEMFVHIPSCSLLPFRDIHLI